MRASFAAANFRPEVIARLAELLRAGADAPEAGRLLRVYQRRLRSNLPHDLRPLPRDRGARSPRRSPR